MQLKFPKIALTLLLIIMFSLSSATAVTNSVAYESVNINGYTVKYVKVDLNNKSISVNIETAKSFPRGIESFGSMTKRLTPLAAINGTYFCTKTYIPVGDIVSNGTQLHRGSVGTAFALDFENKASVLPFSRSGNNNWINFKTVLCSGPRLLTDGEIKINGKSEGFKDPSVFGSPTSRSALGVTANNKLLLITVSNKGCSLNSLASICKQLGAKDAITLDGGSSSALYYDGKTVKSPSRSLSNIVAIYFDDTTVKTTEVATTAVTTIKPGIVETKEEVKKENIATFPKVEKNKTGENSFTLFTLEPKITEDAKNNYNLVNIVAPNYGDLVSNSIHIRVVSQDYRRDQVTCLKIDGRTVLIFNHGEKEYILNTGKYNNGQLKIEVELSFDDYMFSDYIYVDVKNE